MKCRKLLQRVRPQREELTIILQHHILSARLFRLDWASLTRHLSSALRHARERCRFGNSTLARFGGSLRDSDVVRPPK
jgi:hypothetical protein